MKLLVVLSALRLEIPSSEKQEIYENYINAKENSKYNTGKLYVIVPSCFDTCKVINTWTVILLN